MRILHVIPSFDVGGMEKIICYFINMTNCYEHEILSINNHYSATKWLNDKSFKAINFRKEHSRLDFFRKLYSEIRKSNPEFLMTYNWGATDAIWIGRRLGIKKIIHSEHGFNIDETIRTDKKRNLIRYLLYRLSSRIIVVSKDLKEMMKKNFHINENRIVFIPNGIDTNLYYPDCIQKYKIRKELRISEDDYVIGFCGRLDEVKNFDLMLRIFNIFRKRYGSCKLMIVGNGSEKLRIEEICEKERTLKDVILLGEKEDTIPYLRAMDVFLLTSYREQMPLSILEAMSVGLPVIASDVGEVPSVVDHKKNGFIFRLDDSLETTCHYLNHLRDVNIRKSMGELGRKKVVENFNVDTMVQKYKTVINGLCQPITSLDLGESYDRSC